MRHLPAAISIAFAAALLAGCTTSESDFKLGMTAMAESPSIRRHVQNECVADLRNDPITVKQEGAAHMKVPVSKYAETLCQRIVNAMANGRLTYADYKSIRTEKTSAKVMRIIKG